MSETKIVAVPTHVGPTVDKNGRKRQAHLSTRHRAVPVSEEGSGENSTPLDGWITKHGGAEHLRKTLEEMAPHERAKLLDAMAHIEGTDAAGVMKKLGIHEPELSEDQRAVDDLKAKFRAALGAAVESGVITKEEHDAVIDTCEEDGLEAAIEQLKTLRDPPADPDPAPPAPPVVEHVESVARANGAAIAVALEQSSEGAAGIRASLEAQAAEMYQQHVEAQNKAHRANFEIEKRGIRGWRVTEAMKEEAARYQADAANYLAKWTAFVQEHGLGDGLS